MLAQIRRNKVFSKISMMAYFIAGIVLINPLHLQERLLLRGDTLALWCGILFLIGMGLQFVQLMCDGGCLYHPWPARYALIEEDVKELLKYIEELD